MTSINIRSLSVEVCLHANMKVYSRIRSRIVDVKQCIAICVYDHSIGMGISMCRSKDSSTGISVDFVIAIEIVDICMNDKSVLAFVFPQVAVLIAVRKLVLAQYSCFRQY